MEGIMPEFRLILLTAFLTASFGILGALIGYIIINFVIEPIKELKKEIAEVSMKLVFWAAALSSPGTHSDKSEAYTDFRKSSSLIRAKYYVIPGRKFWGWLFRIPNAKNINIAAKALIFLSNTVTSSVKREREISLDHIEKSKTKLKKALKIETEFE